MERNIATPQPVNAGALRRHPRQNASTLFSNAFDPASKAFGAASQTGNLFLFHSGLLASVIAAQHFLDECDETTEKGRATDDRK
jgi:hypothetical protein